MIILILLAAGLSEGVQRLVVAFLEVSAFAWVCNLQPNKEVEITIRQVNINQMWLLRESFLFVLNVRCGSVSGL